jgi:hypothetical protein
LGAELMNVLFTGKGSSGSWKIRGEQLGHALHAVVKPKATRQDCQAADLIVVVKRISSDLLANIRKSGKPWVFDAVDFYPQPDCSTWSREHAIDWVRHSLAKLKPNAVIWPNQAMMEDCGKGYNGIVLYHHHRPGMPENPIRKEIAQICYEGAEAYIGGWLPAILKECQARGWHFRINLGHLADSDIVLAIRDEKYCGYAQRHWKSNVKLANAHGSGTPFIGPCESGYSETATGYEKWVESPEFLKCAFDELDSQELRQTISREFLRNKITINEVAAQYQRFLHGV